MGLCIGSIFVLVCLVCDPIYYAFCAEDNQLAPTISRVRSFVLDKWYWLDSMAHPDPNRDYSGAGY
jgi:hypothetical protein